MSKQPFRFTLFGSGIKVSWGDDPLDYVILSAERANTMRRELSKALAAQAEVDGYRTKIAHLNQSEGE